MGRILIACEKSGRVRDAFRAFGHDAWSCDLEPTQTPGPHIQGDVLNVIGWGWTLMVAHPECRYLSSSGLFRNRGNPERQCKTQEALDFARALFDAPIPLIAIENPVGRLGTAIRKAEQIVQPYDFGDDASKKTCLWLKGLPKLPVDPAARCPGRWATDARNGRLTERWANQTDQGQNRLGPSEDRSAIRATTYPGIARAMALTWGPVAAGELRLAA